MVAHDEEEIVAIEFQRICETKKGVSSRIIYAVGFKSLEHGA